MPEKQQAQSKLSTPNSTCHIPRARGETHCPTVRACASPHDSRAPPSRHEHRTSDTANSRAATTYCPHTATKTNSKTTHKYDGVDPRSKETQNVKSSPSSAASPSAPPVRPRSPAFVVRLLYACASDEGALYGAAEVAAREARSRHPLRNRVATIRTSSVVQRPPPTSPAVNASVAGPSFPVPTVASSCAPLRAPRQRPRALSPSVTN